jgi:hypothetical protein
MKNKQHNSPVSGKILQQQLWATAGETKETALPALHLRTSAASSPASRR